jgi:hypothetical protein
VEYVKSLQKMVQELTNTVAELRGQNHWWSFSFALWWWPKILHRNIQILLFSWVGKKLVEKSWLQNLPSQHRKLLTGLWSLVGFISFACFVSCTSTSAKCVVRVYTANFTMDHQPSNKYWEAECFASISNMRASPMWADSHLSRQCNCISVCFFCFFSLI